MAKTHDEGTVRFTEKKGSIAMISVPPPEIQQEVYHKVSAIKLRIMPISYMCFQSTSVSRIPMVRYQQATCSNDLHKPIIGT